MAIRLAGRSAKLGAPWIQIVLLQAALDLFKCLLGRFSKLEKVEVGGIDHAFIDENLKVQQSFPILAAIHQNNHLLDNLSRLDEREDFKQFVERAESPRE